MLEIETKVIGIDVPSVRKSLKARKAKFLGKFLLKRYVFNLSNKEGEDNYVRIRTDGKKATLTYKFRKGKGLRNTTEIETGIEDFEKAARIFSRIIKERYYQENLRESYLYKGAAVDINTWPEIPPYVEVEGRSAKHVYGCIRALGIKGKTVGNISAVQLYRLYGKDLHSEKAVRFRQGEQFRPKAVYADGAGEKIINHLDKLQ